MSASPPASNPDRRALPDGWITRYDEKCVLLCPVPLPQLTLRFASIATVPGTSGSSQLTYVGLNSEIIDCRQVLR